jgi:RNA polymerase sigma-70 factor (ECF subfamily)
MRGQAVERLYHRHASAIEAHCSRLLGRSADASDAVHETFARVLARAEAPASDEHAVRSLFRISTHVCIDVLRQRGVRTRALPELALRARDLQAQQPDYDSRSRFAQLLAGCDELGRSILLMHVCEGRGRSEIAGALGTSRRTVWSRLKRIERLAGQLGRASA